MPQAKAIGRAAASSTEGTGRRSVHIVAAGAGAAAGAETEQEEIGAAAGAEIEQDEIGAAAGAETEQEDETGRESEAEKDATATADTEIETLTGLEVIGAATDMSGVGWINGMPRMERRRRISPRALLP